MVHEHVAARAMHGEDVDPLVVGGLQAGLGDRHPRLVLEVGAVEVVQRPEPAEVERAGVHVDGLLVEVELAHEQVADLVGDVGVDLEAHGPAEPAAAQLDLDRGEQVVGLLLLEGEVGVAGDPEREVLLDDHPREQLVEVGGDHLLEGHEPLAVGHDHEPGQHGGTFTRAKRRSLGDRVARRSPRG